MSWGFYSILLLLSISFAGSAVKSQTAKGDSSGSLSASESKVSASASNTVNQAWCEQVSRQTVPYYRQLFRQFSSAQGLNASYPVFELLRLKEEDCKNPETQQKIRRALSMHNKRIGLLLPFAPHPQQNFSSTVVEAVQEFYEFQGRKPQQNVVILNTAGNPRSFLLRLAEAVFQHNVSLFIGGASRFEASLLEEWAERLQIPALILHQNSNPGRVLKQSYYISPDRLQLTQAILYYLIDRGIKKLAILAPGNRNDVIIEFLSHRLDRLPTIHHTVYPYRANDYSSMEGIVRRLFRLDDPERQAELEELIQERKEAAEEQGLPFDPRTVFLPPIIEYDAILIADNFKATRHLISIFKYFNAPKIHLIGNQQWRAPEFLSPPESYLDGAVFFDYIGSYRHLLPSIKVPLRDSEFFTTPEHANKVDIKMMAAYALNLADNALANHQIRRYEMYLNFRNMENQNLSFFAPGLVFNQHQSSYWPSFLFRISQNKLELVRTIQVPKHRSLAE